MKITFMEEIEAHHAWRECMYCKKCDNGTYRIHHQITPYAEEPWWIECPNCGYESKPSAIRSGAIARWKRGL